ncbi:cytochrome c maturation protein CcmE [Halomonas denitrificans]|nr:cytochrome c maturation protein CcmE [Halomonas denitrificans]
MTRTRKRRLLIVVLILVGMSLATAVAITAMNQNVMFFVSPTDVAEQELSPERRFRLGGLVADGTVVRAPGSLDVEFQVTDGRHNVPVTYSGILPDLFREGQGVIAHGYLRDGRFEADEVLARHDETYTPPEVLRALEEAGHPGPDTNP